MRGRRSAGRRDPRARLEPDERGRIGPGSVHQIGPDQQDRILSESRCIPDRPLMHPDPRKLTRHHLARPGNVGNRKDSGERVHRHPHPEGPARAGMGDPHATQPFRNWLPAKPGTTVLDVRTGGSWLATVVSSEGAEIALTGCCDEVCEPGRLVMTVAGDVITAITLTSAPARQHADRLHLRRRGVHARHGHRERR